jgi:outer membrane protein
MGKAMKMCPEIAVHLERDPNMKIVQLFISRCVPAVFFLSLLICTWVYPQKVMTLEESLEIAMLNSPDILRSKLQLERSQESLNAQNAALKSRFSLSVTPFDYSQDRQFNDLFSTWYTSENTQSFGTFTISQPIKWTDGTLALNNRLGWQDSYSGYTGDRTKTFSNNLYLSFQQPIFTYNRTKLTLNELQLDLENTSLSYAIQKLSLEKNVTQGFFSVYQNRMSLEVAKEEYENQKISYQIIKNKVDAGISAMEELYQAELNLATSKSNMQNQQVALDNALDSFKKLIGMSLFDEISVLTDISHHPVEVNMQKALDHALLHRMELRQRKITIENSQFDLIRTQAMNEFKGDITLSYGMIGTDPQFSSIYDIPTKNQRVSLSLDIPLWDWGEKKSRIKASEATIKTNELSLQDQEKDIVIGVRTAYRNLQNQINQIEIARQNERNAQLTYDINLERYKNGDLTSMDLNLFQTQLSEKKMGLVNALINYKIELLNMKIQSLWDFEKNTSVVPDLGIRSM